MEVATALAEWNLHSHTEQLEDDIGSLDDVRQVKPRLTAAHFEVVAQGTQDFEDYMLAATGLTAREHAWNVMEREPTSSEISQDLKILYRTNMAISSKVRECRHPLCSMLVSVGPLRLTLVPL